MLQPLSCIVLMMITKKNDSPEYLLLRFIKIKQEQYFFSWENPWKSFLDFHSWFYFWVDNRYSISEKCKNYEMKSKLCFLSFVFKLLRRIKTLKKVLEVGSCMQDRKENYFTHHSYPFQYAREIHNYINKNTEISQQKETSV